MLEQYISVVRVLRMIRKLDAEMFQKDEHHTGKDLIALGYLLTDKNTPTIWVERSVNDRYTKRETAEGNSGEREDKKDL
jgi:hypothetical protein